MALKFALEGFDGDKVGKECFDLVTKRHGFEVKEYAPELYNIAGNWLKENFQIEVFDLIKRNWTDDDLSRLFQRLLGAPRKQSNEMAVKMLAAYQQEELASA